MEGGCRPEVLRRPGETGGARRDESKEDNGERGKGGSPSEAPDPWRRRRRAPRRRAMARLGDFGRYEGEGRLQGV